MSIIKFAIIGAAVAYGVTEIIKRRENGKSILDDLTEHAPDWMEDAKEYAVQAIDGLKQTVKSI